VVLMIGFENIFDNTKMNMVSGFNGSFDQMTRFKNKGDRNVIKKSKEIIWLKSTHHLEYLNQNANSAYFM
jgi:hypothetical protein